MTLAELFEELMDDDGSPARSSPRSDGSIAWQVGGVDFSVVDPTGMAVSFRLDPELAAAAQRTPDVSASALGPAWVRFQPALLDDHAEDRALAWFEAAYRRAATRAAS